ncbi:MAG: cupredoxin domain-containing protein [Thermoplasmata archaeon]
MGFTRIGKLGTAASVAVIAVLVLLFVAGASVITPVARAATPHPATSMSLTIGVTDEFEFQPNTFEAPTPGENVSITIMQMGSTAHTFTLFSVANFAFDPATNTTTQLESFVSEHPPLANVNISATAGFSVTVNFKAPPLGIYQYVCLEPGHFQLGMEGFMGSGEPPPGVSTAPTGPGAAVFIISGTIAALLVIAIVLGFVIGQRKGSVHEMPPERLGYPEPTDPSAEALPSSPKPPGET